MNIDQEKITALLQDEDFVERLTSAQTMEDKLAVLHEEGIEMTSDELRQAMKDGEQLLKDKGLLTADGELGEDALENVAGGRNWKMVAVGAVIGVASGFAGQGGGVVLGAALIYLGWNS